jgi:DnaJ-class molecular chaperone
MNNTIDIDVLVESSEIYDPKGKCEHCMGSGHIARTVRLQDSMDGYILIRHCPVCNGTGKENGDEAHPIS